MIQLSIYIYSFLIPFPYRLLQNIEYSSPGLFSHFEPLMILCCSFHLKIIFGTMFYVVQYLFISKNDKA